MRRFLFLPVLVALLWLAPAGLRARATGPSFPRPTFNAYDERIDRPALITDECGQARASRKRTLLVFGSNDYGPCRKLHDRRPLGQIVKSRYVAAHVTVNGVRDRDLAARYGSVKAAAAPLKAGCPVTSARLRRP